MTWLDEVNNDASLSADARALAKVMFRNFGTAAEHYVAARDVELAQVMGTPMYVVVNAKQELIDGHHIRPLVHWTGRPSYRLSSSRW